MKDDYFFRVISNQVRFGYGYRHPVILEGWNRLV